MTSISLVNQGLKPLIVVALGCVFFFGIRVKIRQFFGDQKMDWLDPMDKIQLGLITILIAIPQKKQEFCSMKSLLSPSWWWRFYQLQRVVTWQSRSVTWAFWKWAKSVFFPKMKRIVFQTIVFWGAVSNFRGRLIHVVYDIFIVSIVTFSIWRYWHWDVETTIFITRHQDISRGYVGIFWAGIHY